MTVRADGTRGAAAGAAGGAASTSSVRRLREENLRSVLLHVWDAGGGAGSGAVTGSDLMAATGLSRATAHAVCEELIERGWLRELENARASAGYVKGRPARRYALAARAGLVVGVDAGAHRVCARVTDLRGTPLGTVARRADPDHLSADPAARLAVLRTAALDALAAAGAGPSAVLTAVVGVPAPVDADGRTTFSGNPYWEYMNPGIAVHLERELGWDVVVDNDANLAAVAEHHRGGGRGARSHVTLLAGERFGAGVVEDGRLLRGAHGGVGEMRYLDVVEGVGSTDGIARLVRERTGREAEEVLAAAAAGDAAAVAVTEEVGQVLTRVVATLASLLDTSRVVVAGAVAASAGPVLEVVHRALPRFVDPPRPEVVASRLGADVVVLGAVERALEVVRQRAPDLPLPR
ncbi:ROK family protein [Kineococcus sp. SYSU DK004]|uniref:ROK family protein n=1 Tax=Kineococcus sp. SYSU DK004 TaxID=3383125 RepID=UPI003D7E47F2